MHIKLILYFCIISTVPIIQASVHVDAGNQAIQYTCEKNDYDKKQHCMCKPGEFIKRMKSTHSSGNEDRQWELTCDKLPDNMDKYSSSMYRGKEGPNSYDANFDYPKFPNNGYLIGITSVHSNHYEDRQYTFHYHYSENMVLYECSDTYRVLNDMDGEMDFILNTGRVIVGIKSVHNSKAEDRRFWIKICKIMPKCNEIYDIIYKTEGITPVWDPIVAGQGYLNNLDGTGDSKWNVEVSKSEAKSLSDSQSYSRTEGFAASAGASFGIAYSTEVPNVSKTTYSVEVSTDITTSKEEGWSRETSTDTTDEISTTAGAEHECPGGMYCLGKIIVTQAKISIPYEIKMKNKITGVECQEKGIFEKVQSFGADTIFEDLTRDEYEQRKKEGTDPMIQ